MIAFLLALVSHAHALQVVCTLPYLGDLAHRVAPSATVTTLARGTDDPHVLSPTPALMSKVATADLYVENGLNLEIWSERLLDSAGNPKIRPGQSGYVLATTGMSRLEVPTDLTRAKGDLHPEGNPHVWKDPLNAIAAADNIALGLGRVDPANAATYTANAKAFRKLVQERLYGADLVGYMGGDTLMKLDQAGKLESFLASKGLSSRLGGWKATAAPLRGKPVVLYHAAWAYFVNRFGLKVVGYVEDRPGIPPTAAHRDELVAVMKREGAKVVEVTSYYDVKVPTLLAQSVGGRVALTPGDVGGTAEAKDYLGFIDSLIKAFL
ncbi:MAG: zinc ABC transporter substrate-binding protein [Deltaproteobacteria bacterium]|nr:zinc ABC transporter substrate-binding protein [Deltaproteobacteria bacterium]